MPLTAFQYLVLGIVQGITEWLPISSSGILALILSNFFQVTEVETIISELLFLHLGTFLAAAIYFRKDVSRLLKTLFRYGESSEIDERIFSFIFISTLVTGAIGIIILQLLNSISLELTGKTISLAVGFLLLITGIFQIKVQNRGIRKENTLENSDGILLGFVQGLSTMPGLSRSGITISTLLLKKFDDTSALRLSFLMSLPVVLLGNLLINWNHLALSGTAFLGLLASFAFGLATIHTLMKLSRKIKFGWFIILFAVLMMISVMF